MDGLKCSLRKILYSAFIKNLKYSSKTTIKVAQLAGFVSEKTNYHHGEMCLFDTITKMAQDFVGSNNIPLLYRGGMFGSRLEMGKDAANARYIFTKLDRLTRLIFRQEDDPLLTHIVDDGYKIEPEFFVPIIPMVLANGVICAIGTGWSSNIPAYRPTDLIECIRAWLINKCYDDQDEKCDIKSYVFPEIHPWYNKFQGTIEKVGDDKYITRGVITRKDLEVTVSELPIGMSITKFKEFGEDLLEAKKIKGFKNYSTDNEPRFVIQETGDENGVECSVETLKLTSNLNTSNMVLFTDIGIIRKYEDIDSILEDFCRIRYQYYIKRKNYLLKNLEHELKIVQNKMKFLVEVMDGTLSIRDIDENDLVRTLIQRGYYGIDTDDTGDDGGDNEKLSRFRYLVNMNIRSFTKQKLGELQKNIETITDQLSIIQLTSPAEMWLKDLKEFETEYIGL
jgi:DNA topoisomerase-2